MLHLETTLPLLGVVSWQPNIWLERVLNEGLAMEKVSEYGAINGCQHPPHTQQFLQGYFRKRTQE